MRRKYGLRSLVIRGGLGPAVGRVPIGWDDGDDECLFIVLVKSKADFQWPDLLKIWHKFRRIYILVTRNIIIKQSKLHCLPFSKMIYMPQGNLAFQ